MSRLRALLPVVMLATLAAHAAPPPALDYTRNTAVEMVMPSPSGKRLALVTASAAGRHALSVLDLPPAAPARVVGAVGNADVDRVLWISDDRLVFHATLSEETRVPGQGMTYGVDHDGGRLKALGWWVLRAAGDGSADAIVANFRSTVGGEPTDTQIFRIDTLTGNTRRQLDWNMPSHVRTWLFDAAGNPVVVQTVQAGRSRLHRRDAESGRWTVFEDHAVGTPDALTPVYLEADGKLIVRTHAGRDTAGYHAYDLQTAKLDPAPLVRLERYDVGSYENDDQQRRIVGVHAVADRPLSVWFSARMTAVQAAVDAALPGRFNRVLCGHCDTSRFYSVLSQSDRDPGHFSVYDADKRLLTPVGATRPWIGADTQGRRSFHWTSARDGTALPLVVTHPPGSSATEPIRAVVLVHGGPWLRGADRRWSAEAQFLASRGWRVIEPDFRGSTGYGQRHFRAGWKQWGLAMQDDLADAVAWAVDQKLVHPARVCIYGASYGGYAALMGTIRHPQLYRCAASFAGVTDIELMYSSGWADFSSDNRRYSMPILIGDPKADAEQLRGTSPLQRVAEIRVPLLVAQGTQDRRVPREHANAFVSAARRAGVKVERIDYAEQGHGFHDPKQHADFLEDLERFLRTSLAP